MAGGASACVFVSPRRRRAGRQALRRRLPRAGRPTWPRPKRESRGSAAGHSAPAGVSAVKSSRAVSTPGPERKSGVPGARRPPTCVEPCLSGARLRDMVSRLRAGTAGHPAGRRGPRARGARRWAVPRRSCSSRPGGLKVAIRRPPVVIISAVFRHRSTSDLRALRPSARRAGEHGDEDHGSRRGQPPRASSPSRPD